MAVEARHRNLFPSQLLANRELYNPLENNLYSNVDLLPTTPKPATMNNNVHSYLPLYNNHADELVLCAKTSSYPHHTPPPPLRDDSGITYNHNIMPPISSRKRSRDNSTPTTTTTTAAAAANNNSTVPLNTTFFSMPLSSTIGSSISINGNSTPGKENGPHGSSMADDGCVAGAGPYTFLGEDMSVQMMQQQIEFDRLISIHMQKVRSEVEEIRRKQMRRMITAMEETIAKKLSDKEQEIKRIGKLNWELEGKVNTICLENQIWRDMAQTNEAAANALRNNLEQVLAAQASNKYVGGLGDDDGGPGFVGGIVVEDEGSCCGSNGEGGGGEEDEVKTPQQLKWRKVGPGPCSSGGIISAAADDCKKDQLIGCCAGKNENNNDDDKKRSRSSSRIMRRMCRKCGKGESSVLLVPCRHLCLCAGCGPAANNCPICNCMKEGSVHVYLA